jgi:quercetin dioxygenase-like cupin family protein
MGSHGELVDIRPAASDRTSAPGFRAGVRADGEVVTKISGQEQRTFRTGEMLFEPPGSTHEVSRNASDAQPARLLAMIFAKKNSPLTGPA